VQAKLDGLFAYVPAGHIYGTNIYVCPQKYPIGHCSHDEDFGLD